MSYLFEMSRRVPHTVLQHPQPPRQCDRLDDTDGTSTSHNQPPSNSRAIRRIPRELQPVEARLDLVAQNRPGTHQLVEPIHHAPGVIDLGLRPDLAKSQSDGQCKHISRRAKTQSGIDAEREILELERYAKLGCSCTRPFFLGRKDTTRGDLGSRNDATTLVTNVDQSLGQFQTLYGHLVEALQ